MKKNTKDFIAKLLVLCLIIGLLPTVALATGPHTSNSGNAYYTISSDVTISNGKVSIAYTPVDESQPTTADFKSGIEYKVGSETNVTLTFTANSGYTFGGITYAFGGSTETVKSNPVTIKVTQDIEITAITFTAVQPSTVAVTGVTLDKTALELTVGGTGTLTATVTPANATNKTVTWASSDTAVATVSNGTVTAVAAGTATITATAGGKTATCTVTVTAAETEVPEAVVEVPAEATTDENGTAKAEVSEKDLTDAVEAAIEAAEAEDAAPVVKIEVTVDEDAKNLEVTLPTASLEALAETEGSSLVIVSGIAEIKLDNTALNALVDQAEGSSTVALEVASVTADDEGLTEGQQDILADLGDAEEVIDLSLVNGSTGEAISNYNGGTLTITVPYTLPESGDADSVRVYYLNDDGELTLVNATYKNGKVTFTTTHLSKYVISARLLLGEFIDVVQGWYSGAVDWAVRKNITTGTGGNKFSPARNVFRAEIVTWLWRLAGSPEPTSTENPFTDVNETTHAPYYKAILWAYEKGIATGRGENKFAPGATCTRGEFVTLLYRYVGEPEVEGTSTSFSDLTSDWYKTAVIWAAENGVTNGRGGNRFAPAENTSRAEGVTFLCRADNLD